MRHIELLGVPGSAKSTVAREMTRTLPGAVGLDEAILIAVRRSGQDGMARLVAHVTRSGRNPFWRSAYARSKDRFAALTRFIEAHPEVMQRVAKTQRRRSDQNRDQSLVLGWLLNLMARYQLAIEAEGAFETLVIDEGFCQRAVALFGYALSEKDTRRLNEYLKAIPLPDVVVVVDTPLEECERRLDGRGWSERVADLDPVSRHDFLRDTAVVVDTVIRFLETTGTRVITVDGTTPTEDVGHLLVKMLASVH